MITQALRGALRSILLGVPGLPADVKWQGRVYKPVEGTPYVSETLDPIAARVATLGGHGATQDDYQYRVRVHWPNDANTDLHDGEAIADAIRAAFHPARLLMAPVAGEVYHGRIMEAEGRAQVEGDGWNVFPIIVNCHVRRCTVPHH